MQILMTSLAEKEGMIRMRGGQVDWGEGDNPKKRMSPCHPDTLTAFEAVLYATASREFHSNPVPLKMAPELYESTGLWQTVPLKQGADVHARGPCHSVTLALGQGDNGMSPCHPAVTLVFDFATKSFCA